MNKISKVLNSKTFLGSVLVLSILMLGLWGRSKMQNESIKPNERAINIQSLFNVNKVTEEDLKNLWLPQLKAIEGTNLSNISDENEIMADCFSFSNSLTHAAQKLFAKEQKTSTKEFLLQLSNRVTNFSRKLRNIIAPHGEKLSADTFWLSVSYNDNRLNVWSLINSVVFDVSDNIEVIEYYLLEISTRLNEAVDCNIYLNILEEIEHETPDLINKLYEKVQRLGGQERLTAPSAKKIFNYIEGLVKKRKAQEI